MNYIYALYYNDITSKKNGLDALCVARFDEFQYNRLFTCAALFKPAVDF
jgi:hypothetical protein